MISVVIPAFNEENSITKCLNALNRQETTKEFEVVVVDNASTDKTVQVVKSFKGKIQVRLISERKKGRSPARRAGFSAARGEILLSTDADGEVSPNWVEVLVKELSKPDVVAVSGTCCIDDCSGLVNWIVNTFQPILMHIYKLIFHHYWLSGFNFGIKKKIYNKSGGFNPNLNIQEDTDLAFRVFKLGKIKFIKSPSVKVSGRRFKNGVLRGFVPYVTSFFIYYFMKDEDKVNLSDVR